jgi:hypothetical protein
MKTVKNLRGRIAIVCHSHLFWISTRFKIWGMIFFYIMRQRWCCLYQLPWTTWLSMCQYILKFGSWIVQRVSGGVQMHVHQFCYVQIGYFHYGYMQFGLLFFEYIFLRHKPTEKGYFCNGCLFCKWGHSLRKFWLSYHLLRSGYFMPSTSMHSTFIFIWSLFQEWTYPYRWGHFSIQTIWKSYFHHKHFLSIKSDDLYIPLNLNGIQESLIFQLRKVNLCTNLWWDNVSNMYTINSYLIKQMHTN